MSAAAAHVLANPVGAALARDLARVARRKVDAVDVDDVVQATLLEVLSAQSTPPTPEEIRRFAFLVVRQKIADVHRRRTRDQRIRDDLGVVTEAAATPQSGDDFVRWVERTVSPETAALRTLGWMVREAEGEALSDIARAESVPAPAVRQRVSRLRRLLRERWTREMALAITIVLLVGVAWVTWRASRANIAKTHDERATVPAAASSSDTRRGKCDPPYTIDESGRKRYRVECLNP